MTRTERSRDLRGSEIEILESIRSAVPEMGRSAKLRIKLLADQQLKDVQEKYRCPRYSRVHIQPEKQVHPRIPKTRD